MGRVIITRSQRLKLLNHDDAKEVVLPQDLLLYILTFLHIKTLVTSARYVCKSWAATIPTSQFAQACLLHSKPCLFVENCDFRSSSYFLDIKTYERTDFRAASRMKKRIIDTCNGIFLLFRRRYRPMRTKIYLFNPITNSCLRTLPLPLQETHQPSRILYIFDRLQLALQLTLVCVPHTAKFKLFFADNIKVSGAVYSVFYALTIGIDNSWRVIDRKQVPLQLFDVWKPIYDGANYLYWTHISQGIIVVDVDKEITVANFSAPPVLSLPPSALLYSGKPLSFLRMGNQLSCVVRTRVDHSELFHIYILDFDSGKWSLYHETEPFHFDFVDDCGHRITFKYITFRFWILDQIIFQLVRRPWDMETRTKSRYTVQFSYSVKTRKFTKMEGIAMANHDVWLHTNSLISFPSTPT